MAKKKQDEEQALVPAQSTAIVSATVDDSDVRGKDNIDLDDVVLPRIAVCQNNSPEKDEDDAKFIAGLKEGDLFNSLTQTIYGRGPLDFVIVRLDKKAMQFDGDRKIVDYDVPWDDARCQFTTNAEGKRLKPVATRFYDYVVYIPSTQELGVLSMSNTKVKAAKRLNSLLLVNPGASWRRTYRLGVVKEENAQGKYFNFTIGVAPEPTSAEVVTAAAALYEQFRSTKINVHDQAADAAASSSTDDDIPF